MDDLIDDWPLETNYDGLIECWYQNNNDNYCWHEFQTYVLDGSYTVRRLRQQLREHIVERHPEVLNEIADKDVR